MPHRYEYAKADADAVQLLAEVIALGFGSPSLSSDATIVAVTYQSPLTAQQESALAACVAAHAPNPNNPILRLHAAAAARVQDAISESALRDRAVVLAALDEINVLRSWIEGFKAAVAAAGTLAALKTAVAELPSLPERSATAARNAVVSKINSGGAD